MTNTAIAPVGSTISPHNLDTFNHVLDTVLTSSATVYKWESDTGEIVKLRGSFVYLGDGSVDFANSTVEKVRLFETGSATYDLSIEYTTLITTDHLEDLITGNFKYFWNSLFDGPTDIDLQGDGSVVDINNIFQGFGGDGSQNSIGGYTASADTISISGSGVYSGDFVLFYKELQANDDISINRSDASDDIIVVGDGIYSSFASPRSATGGDDTINDFSSEGGLTYLIGDVGKIAANVDVIGGSDFIYGADIESFLVGDVWEISATTALTITGGDDFLFGGDVGSTLVGDIYDADDSSDFPGEVAHTIIGGNDSIDGGNGDDLIFGEVALLDVSSLSGGDDSISGGQGEDTIYGQTGDDSINGDGGIDLIEGGTGKDTINGGNGADTILGEGGADVLAGDNGDDVIDGGANSDSINGGDANDDLSGGAGKDTIDGDAGDDTIDGGDKGDVLYGGGGADVIAGGKGSDTLSGQADNDILEGGKGHDVVKGGGGEDTLEGNKGNDVLTGGTDADIFVFADGGGDDIITDFDALSDLEDIDLSAVSSITDFADLELTHMTQTGLDVLIDDLAGHTITLTGITLSDLDSADFLF